MDKAILEGKQKKRKAKYSPKNNKALSESSKKLIQKAKRVRKMAQKSMDFFSEESDDEERTHTPSGMELEGKVQGIRSFFSPINKKQTGCSQEKDESEEVNRENERGQLNETQPTGTARDINKRRLNMITGQSADDQNNNKQLHVIACDKSDDFKEDQILKMLTGQLMNAEENTSEDIQANKKRSKEEDTVADSRVIKMVSSTEQNDDENPKTLAISAVVEMLSSLKMQITEQIKGEIRTENNKLREDIRTDMADWKNKQAEEIKENRCKRK